MLYNNGHSISMMMPPTSTSDVNNVEFIGSNRLKMLADNYLQQTMFDNGRGSGGQTSLSMFGSADVKMIGDDECGMTINSKEIQTKPKLSFSIEAIIGIK